MTNYTKLFLLVISILLGANNRLAAQQPSFYYTVDCSNNITWTIENNSQYINSIITDSMGINITNITKPPLEGSLVNLVCTNGAIRFITSQHFTLRACLMPSFVYHFTNNGANINVATTNDSLQSDLSYSLNGIVQGTGHVNATPDFIYNDSFPSDSTTNSICVKAIYKNLGGNIKNTACRERCAYLFPQNCGLLTANIIGQNLDIISGQPAVLTIRALFNGHTPLAEIYTYQWSTGSSLNNITINPTSITTYTVTVTSDRGCSATAIQYLPVWQVKDTMPCMIDSFVCMPIYLSKKIVNAAALSFKIVVSSHIDIVDVNTAALPATTTKIVIINNTRDTANIILLDTINFINSSATGTNIVGCLKLKKNGLTQLNNIITIQGTVKEYYVTGALRQRVIDSFKFKMPDTKYTIRCIPTENIKSNAPFTVSPNPTTGNLYLNSIDGVLIGKQVKIYDILGQELESTILQSQNQMLDLSAYSAGMYLVRIGNISIKVIKQ